MKSKRIITIKKDILKESDELANKLRKKFAKHNVFVVNIVSSPGSGKTELLGQTLKKLKKVR